MGTYKFLVKGPLGEYWVYFDYRTRNGIMEAKQRGNAFAEWGVINGIPSGAILV